MSASQVLQDSQLERAVKLILLWPRDNIIVISYCPFLPVSVIEGCHKCCGWLRGVAARVSPRISRLCGKSVLSRGWPIGKLPLVQNFTGSFSSSTQWCPDARMCEDCRATSRLISDVEVVSTVGCVVGVGMRIRAIRQVSHSVAHSVNRLEIRSLSLRLVSIVLIAEGGKGSESTSALNAQRIKTLRSNGMGNLEIRLSAVDLGGIERWECRLQALARLKIVMQRCMFQRLRGR